MNKRLLFVVVGCVSVVGMAYAFRAPSDQVSSTEPREILNRLWFDKLPDKPTDDATIALFFAGGIGLYETGSYYKTSYELLEFERTGSKLEVKFLQDGKKMTAPFKVSSCDEKPPFNRCLDFENAPRGPKRLYGFGRESEESQAVPWARDLKAAGRARATHP